MPQAERMSVRLCPCVSDVSGVGEQEYIAEISAGWSQERKRKIFQDNAAKLYRIELPG